VDPEQVAELVGTLRDSRLPPPRRRRAIRKGAGASLRDIGRVLGVSPMTVSRWEAGVTPRRDRAVAYRKLLHALDNAAAE
jgi:transcriptional regulator with XRE-family HTH domain